MTRATQHSQSFARRHGPPLLVGGVFAVFAALFVQVYPVNIYYGLRSSTPDDLKWVRFGKWKVPETVDAFGQPGGYRDGEPFVRLIYDVQLRQYRYNDEDDRTLYYRNHARISINLPRAIAATIVLSALWVSWLDPMAAMGRGRAMADNRELVKGSFWDS